MSEEQPASLDVADEEDYIDLDFDDDLDYENVLSSSPEAGDEGQVHEATPEAYSTTTPADIISEPNCHPKVAIDLESLFIDEILETRDAEGEHTALPPPAVRSYKEIRGILKCKNSQRLNNEKVVAQCLEMLCQPSNEYDHKGHDAMVASASNVFRNLCFEQFFQNGECISSECEAIHRYKSRLFSNCDKQLWLTALYLIGHVDTPSLPMIENLVQHYITKGNTFRALLFAKCIAKMKDVERLELAHFIVNNLSGEFPTRDIITVILMLNFPDLSPLKFNQFMGDLGIFEQNTSHYSELFTFLDFRRHQMPASSLSKLMDDALKHSCENSFVGSISGFWKRLNPSQKDELGWITNKFEERFGKLSTTDQQSETSKFEAIQTKMPEKQKRKVVFAADPEVCLFDKTECPAEVQSEIDNLELHFSDDDNEDESQQDVPNFYGSSPQTYDEKLDRILQVLGQSCCNWIMNGCSNSECSFEHNFDKDSLGSLPLKDVFTTAEFIRDMADAPQFEILKIFVEFVAEAHETSRVLSFRKCTPKLSRVNGLRLTKLVISLLSKNMGVWGAIEKVLVPDIMDLSSRDDGYFIFDQKLLCFIMSEAIRTRKSLLRYVTMAIMQENAKLTPDAEMIEISSRFVEKFVLVEEEPPTSPFYTFRVEAAPKKFSSSLKVALYQGAQSKYFLAAVMIKEATVAILRDIARDVLYTFLLSNFDRAKVLTNLLENCNKFDYNTRTFARNLFGAVGLSTGIRLYENENLAGTVELIEVMKKFGLNIFELFQSLDDIKSNMTEFNLALIYCSLLVDRASGNDVVDVFLSRCLEPHLETDSIPPQLTQLTAKLFCILTSALRAEESLSLCSGIFVRQESFSSPLDIVQLVDPTLRCAFSRVTDPKIRKEILKLYLHVVYSATPITLHKLTHRSVFLAALSEIIDRSGPFEVKGRINVVHPLIKQMLVVCIKEGVYFDLQTDEMYVYSSMTDGELEVYVMWWFSLFVRARIRQHLDYFPPVTVKIVQDQVQYDSQLPVHSRLRDFNASVTDCAGRLSSVIKKLFADQMSVIPTSERGVILLHPATTRALSQSASTFMLQFKYILGGKDRMCTFCLDKLDVVLSNEL